MPSLNYLSLSSDYKTISLDTSKLSDPANVGNQTFTLVANLTNYLAIS